MQNVIFFGSDQYSATVLSTLLVENCPLKAIITDRAKPKDREQKIEPNPVEKLAINQNIKVLHYPPNLEELHTIIDKETVGLCASFDHLVPNELIELFGEHLYNLHPSLLPQYRNVAPIQYAIALGDRETGITLFKITTGIDNGEIVGQVREPILENDTTPSLSMRLFEQGATLFLKTLAGMQSPPLPYTPASPLVFTRRLTRESGYIEWEVLKKLIKNQPIVQEETKNKLLILRLTHHRELATNALTDLFRALTPWPGVWTMTPTKKGDLRLSIESVLPKLTVKVAGKPKAILYTDFEKYYL